MEASREKGDQADEMMRLLTRLMILPLEVIVSSMEAFSKAMREIQKTFGEGIIDSPPAPAPIIDEAQSDGPSDTTHSETKLPDSTPGLSSSIIHAHNHKEKVHMADQDLSGSDLKLVRYKVLFTKRDYEHAFPEKEELVHDDMECNRFIAWKIAEFVQALKKEEDGVRRIPEKWATYLINEQKRKLTEPERTKIENDFDQEMSKDAKVSFEWEYVEVRRRKGNEHRYYYLRDLPHDDKKHLRLFYEVLDRYPREEFKHDERQIEVLEQIRDRLPR